MTVLPYGFLFRGRALVVEIPPDSVGRGHRLAVGFTEETFKLWHAFFILTRLAGRPSKKNGHAHEAPKTDT